MSKTQVKEARRFREHIRRLSVVSPTSSLDGFDAELTALRLADQRIRSNLDEFYTGSLGSSVAKNRFADVKPNEGTIVRLHPISAAGGGTYINANYVDCRNAFGVPFVYIATQAPLQNTVMDFWRMIYESEVSLVVMLCDIKENGKVKSEQYWPDRGCVLDLGLLAVRTVSETTRPGAVHRVLQVRTVRGDAREVYHMQYLGWPDGGIPSSSAPLMEMIQVIARHPNAADSPIVVHCSGGVGRTGVFIALHVALAQFQLEQSHISVPRIVHFLKMCRSGMVQRKDQYLFLYYAVLREMERMLLSAETGINLLENRPHTEAPRRRNSPFRDPRGYGSSLSSSLVRPVPARYEGALRAGMSKAAPPRAALEAAPAPRDLASDRAVMASYLRRRGVVDSSRAADDVLSNASFAPPPARQESAVSAGLLLPSSPLRAASPAALTTSFAAVSPAVRSPMPRPVLGAPPGAAPASALEAELAQVQAMNQWRRQQHSPAPLSIQVSPQDGAAESYGAQPLAGRYALTSDEVNLL